MCVCVCVCSDFSSLLGISKKMGLTGRILKRIGVLSTSMLYCVKQEVFAFYPSVSLVSTDYVFPLG